jgi:hypothetical protein
VLAVFYSEVRMGNVNLVVTIKLAWWLRLYIYGIATMAAITGAEPNWDRVKYWVARGTTAKIKAAR